jgi:hypothetical protein
VQKVKIRRPRMDDLEELNQFFKIVITDTFAREGLTELNDLETINEWSLFLKG